MNEQIIIHTKKKSYIVFWTLLIVGAILSILGSFPLSGLFIFNIFKWCCPLSIMYAVYTMTRHNTDTGNKYFVCAFIFGIIYYMFYTILGTYFFLPCIIAVILNLVMMALVEFSYLKHKQVMILIAAIGNLIAALWVGGFDIYTLVVDMMNGFFPVTLSIYYFSDCLYFVALFVLFFFNMYLTERKQKKLNDLYRNNNY